MDCFLIGINLTKIRTLLRIEYLSIFFKKGRNKEVMNSIVIQVIHHKYVMNDKIQTAERTLQGLCASKAFSPAPV